MWEVRERTYSWVGGSGGGDVDGLRILLIPGEVSFLAMRTR